MTPELAWQGPSAWDATTIQEDLGLLLLGKKDATKGELVDSLAYLTNLLRELYQQPRRKLQREEEALTVPRARISLDEIIIIPVWQGEASPNHFRYLSRLNPHWATDKTSLERQLPVYEGWYSLGWGYAIPLATRDDQAGYLYLHHGVPLGEQWGLEVRHHPHAPSHLRRLNHQQPRPSAENLRRLEQLIKA